MTFILGLKYFDHDKKAVGRTYAHKVIQSSEEPTQQKLHRRQGELEREKRMRNGDVC